MSGFESAPTKFEEATSLLHNFTPSRRYETLQSLSSLLVEGEVDQNKLAEQFFHELMVRNCSRSNLEKAYETYRALSGTKFARRFSELEDARLKAAGYNEGFNL